MSCFSLKRSQSPFLDTLGVLELDVDTLHRVRGERRRLLDHLKHRTLAGEVTRVQQRGGFDRGALKSALEGSASDKLADRAVVEVEGEEEVGQGSILDAGA